MNYPGIILITSCHKHLSTRVKELRVPREVDGWPVVMVVGDPRLSADFEWRLDGVLVVRCEDSYFHLLKKIYLTLEIILKKYSLDQGALICGDDVLFNYEGLSEFLRLSPKADYMGHVTPSEGPKKMYNTFMADYFVTHPHEWDNPINGIRGIDISKCVVLPCAPRIAGTIRYVSLKSIRSVIDFMKSIDWNCFHYDQEYGFMTLCEDLSVGAIMQKFGIPLTFYKLVAQTEDDFKTGDWVGWTTNKDK